MVSLYLLQRLKKLGNKSIVQKIIDEFYADEITVDEFRNMLEQEGCYSFFITQLEREKYDSLPR
jgi:hypothetical protein